MICGHDPSDGPTDVINEVEPVMLETVMQYAGGNQTHAAEILGINRSTLRKKLRQYEIEI
ncbi:helix-turn-helix domain-containing protein [Thiohalobacter thiocyanaticus]|uniref:Fis family transcriptional regulator n=1 Tax=Thiohalobacter thiocyanaticus TaxID=585455 RepID=A0A426QI41_9GAMM|nr:Fis family transcriptional regulator [Thiohalobacter thiocyanaticus]